MRSDIPVGPITYKGHLTNRHTYARITLINYTASKVTFHSRQKFPGYWESRHELIQQLRSAFFQ